MGSAGVTRADVARLAGVSTAVVSYVVNGGPKHVSPHTAERVRKAIADLRYQPNALARALTTGSPQLLGFIAPDLTNPYFAELADAVSAAASGRGLDLIVASTGDDPGRERSITLNLVGRRVDGIIAATVLDPVSLAAMNVGTTPRVLVDDMISIADTASIGTDLEDGAFQATHHLIGHGYLNVGIVTGPQLDQQRLDSRRAGWLRALASAGVTPGPVIETEFTRQGGHQAMTRLLRSSPAPRALFAASDLLAVGVLRALHEARLRVPDDVAIVSFDGSAESDFSWPRLTSLRQPITEIAERAVAEVLGPGTTSPRRRIHGTLVVRDSCGCGRVTEV